MYVGKNETKQKTQPRKNTRGQGRFQHPECRWKDVSCIKSLLTKKGYEQRRLENAIRNTATGASPSPRVSGGSVPAAENGRANGSCSEGANRGKEGMAGGNGKEAGVRNEVAGGAGGGEKSPAGCKKAKRIRSKGLKEEVAERTELEVATEAAVVRAREVGMEARMELRQSMSRCERQYFTPQTDDA